MWEGAEVLFGVVGVRYLLIGVNSRNVSTSFITGAVVYVFVPSWRDIITWKQYKNSFDSVLFERNLIRKSETPMEHK